MFCWEKKEKNIDEQWGQADFIDYQFQLTFNKLFFFAKKKLLNPETCKFIALVTEGFISEDLYFIVETRTKKKEKETPNEMPLLNQGESVFMSY